MTGAEHYRQADHLLASHGTILSDAKAKVDANPLLGPDDVEAALDLGATLLEKAQVHATLALAAASVEGLSWWDDRP